MDSRPAHPFLETNGSSEPQSTTEAHSNPANPSTPLWLHASPDEGAGEYTSPSDLQSMEALRALPVWTVATPVRHAPFRTAGLAPADCISPVPPEGGDGDTRPSPASRNAVLASLRGPLTHLTTFDVQTEAAL